MLSALLNLTSNLKSINGILYFLNINKIINTFLLSLNKVYYEKKVWMIKILIVQNI